MKDKRGQFGALQDMALGVGIFIIIAVVVASVLSGFQDTQTDGDLDYNITQTGLEGVEDLTDWTPTLVAIGVGVVILGMIFMFGRPKGR